MRRRACGAPDLRIPRREERAHLCARRKGRADVFVRLPRQKSRRAVHARFRHQGARQGRLRGTQARGAEDGIRPRGSGARERGRDVEARVGRGERDTRPPRGDARQARAEGHRTPHGPALPRVRRRNGIPLRIPRARTSRPRERLSRSPTSRSSRSARASTFRATPRRGGFRRTTRRRSTATRSRASARYRASSRPRRTRTFRRRSPTSRRCRPR